MHKSLIFQLFLIGAIFVSISSEMLAQVSLIKDTYQGVGNASSHSSEFTILNDRLYFKAISSLQQGLWVTDGTEEGTQIVAPLITINEMVAWENALYFAGYTPEHGNELWKSDGTTAGTQLLVDIAEGPFGSGPIHFFPTENALFFQARIPEFGYELWASDGTKEGTRMMKDFKEGTGSTNSIQNMVEHQNNLYFTIKNADGIFQIWKSDGSPEGTQPVLSADTLAGNFPGHLYSWNDELYFTLMIESAISEFELWKMNREGSAIRRLFNIGDITDSDDFVYLPYQGSLYVTSFLGDPGRLELWKTNGESEGFEPIYDFGIIQHIEGAKVVGDDLIFVYSSNCRYSVAYSKGTPETTVVDTTFDAICGSILNFVVVDTTLFFAQYPKLWRSSGSPETTFLINDISVQEATGFQGKLFFEGAELNDTLGVELFVSDGTAVGTFRLKDINTLPFGGIRNLKGTDNKVFFIADSEEYGDEVWASDGTTTGTQLVKDIFSSTDSLIDPTSNPHGLTVIDDHLYFSARDIALNRPEVYRLWKTDGISEGIQTLGEITPSSFNPQGNITSSSNWVEFKGKIYLAAEDDPFSLSGPGEELWITDGTNEGTELFKNINPEGINLVKRGSKPRHLTPVEDQLFFTAFTDTTGYELWVTDGTAENTRQVKDINPGIGEAINWRFTQVMTPLGDRVLFVANDSQFGFELWISDGTAENTFMVKDLSEGESSSNIFQLIPISEEKVVFLANIGGVGYELWVTDGTSAGTMLVKDIYPGFYSGVASLLTQWNEKVYFMGATPEYGNELWVSDGTQDGTLLVKDIMPGFLGSYPDPGNFLKTDSLLYFSVFDQNRRHVLWQTDGTYGGTRRANGFTDDFFRVYQPHGINGDIIFNGVHKDYGGALFKFSPSPITNNLLPVNSDQQVTVYPNPTKEFVEISFRKPSPQTSIQLLDFSGKQLRTYSFEQPTPVKVELAGLAAGNYLLRIITRDHIYIRKLVLF